MAMQSLCWELPDPESINNTAREEVDVPHLLALDSSQVDQDATWAGQTQNRKGARPSTSLAPGWRQHLAQCRWKTQHQGLVEGGGKGSHHHLESVPPPHPQVLSPVSCGGPQVDEGGDVGEEGPCVTVSALGPFHGRKA